MVNFRNAASCGSPDMIPLSGPFNKSVIGDTIAAYPGTNLR